MIIKINLSLGQPSIVGHPLSTFAEEGETATFVCQFKGPDFPITRVQWWKNVLPIPGEIKTSDLLSLVDVGDGSRIRNFENNVTLVISPVRMTDAGEYACEIMSPGFPPIRSRPAQLFVKGIFYRTFLHSLSSNRIKSL